MNTDTGRYGPCGSEFFHYLQILEFTNFLYRQAEIESLAWMLPCLAGWCIRKTQRQGVSLSRPVLGPEPGLGDAATGVFRVFCRAWTGQYPKWRRPWICFPGSEAGPPRYIDARATRVAAWPAPSSERDRQERSASIPI